MRLPCFVAACAVTACFQTAPEIESDGSTAADTTSGTGPTDTETDTDAEPGPVVTVRGRLTSTIGLDVPQAGMKVVLVGDETVETLTDAQGAFALAGVPAGGARFIAAIPTQEYVGSIVGIDVPFIDLEDVKVPRLSRLDVKSIVDALTLQNADLEYDTTSGNLLVTSNRGDTVITVEPMPGPGTYYALDAEGTPVLGANASQYFVPSVIYFNLAPTPAGTLQVNATHATSSCVVPLSQPPVVSDHVSWLRADCR